MIDFLICYEHINREIENDALIKYELEKRGYSCEIISFSGPGYYNYSKKKNRAKVVVTPWLRYNEDIFYYLKLCDKNNKLVNLQWEQVYSKANIDSGLCAVTGESKKATHICWGNNSKERLKSFGIEESLLPVTGALQTDYGREIFKNYYKSREEIAKEYNLDLNKPWILFVSSFAYVNYSKEGIAVQVKKFGKHINDLVSLNEKSFGVCIKWFEQFLSEYDCEFIYRPHPSENGCEKLSVLEKNFNNFHIISDYSVKQWASVCDKINLWISTSNAEIAFMGKNYFTLRPLEIPEKLQVESMKNEETIDTYEDFFKVNTQPYNSVDLSLKIENLLKYYDFDSTIPAYIRVTDYLESVLKKKATTKYTFSVKEKLNYGLFNVKHKFFSFIEEKQINHPNSNIIKFLPFNKIIKNNLKKSINNCYLANNVMNNMLNYLKNNEF